MTGADDIGIVTAFFDIGRSDWTAAAGFPDHLHRTTETYIERFAHLATLDNEMVVYTSPELAPRIMDLRRGKEDRTVVVPFPLSEMFSERREAIRRVQTDPAFLATINPTQIRNPEYWSADYVLLMSLKGFFATHAIQNNLIHPPQIAWLDFGYCRGREALAGSRKWQYPFTPGKIHYFTFGQYNGELSIAQIIANNIVYVAGAAIVAERDLWLPFSQLTSFALNELLKRNLVDDDQTLLLLASLYRPELFELHPIPDQDWQPVLRLFNTQAR